MSFDQTFTRRQLALGAAVAGVAATGVLRATAAQEASPEASPEGPPADGGGLPPIPEGAVVVAEGLWNPGDLAFGEDGTLFIAETGVAGGEGGPTDEPPAGGADATPVAAPAPLVPAQISQVAPDGTQSVLTDEIGGVGIGVYAGSVYVSQGGSSVFSGLVPNPAENTVRAVDLATGETRLIAELGPYEVEFNPDGTDVNPNLYGLGINSQGQIFVADAGGNTIYQVDSATGAFSLFAVVPDLTQLTGATPTAEEAAAQPGPRQPVPTSVVIDAGGNVVVALLSEAWNGPSILSFAPNGTYTIGVSGLSNIVSAALGPDGLLYVSQLSADLSGEQPAPGAVLRINADGSIEPVVEGLFFSHGIAFDASGNLFVTTNSIISGPDAPLGQVLRIDGIATPA